MSNNLSFKQALDILLHRPGAMLKPLYGKEGLEYFVVPRGRLKRRDADKILARTDIEAFDAGLFPGNPQSFRLVR